MGDWAGPSLPTARPTPATPPRTRGATARSGPSSLLSRPTPTPTSSGESGMSQESSTEGSEANNEASYSFNHWTSQHMELNEDLNKGTQIPLKKTPIFLLYRLNKNPAKYVREDALS